MADARASAGRNLSQRGPVPGGAPSLPGLRRRLRHDRVRAQHRRRVQWAVQLRAACRIRLHRLLFVPTLRSLVAPASDPHAPVDSTECTFDVTGTDLAAGVGSYMTAMRSFATCAEQYEEGKIVILSPNCLLSVSLIQKSVTISAPGYCHGALLDAKVLSNQQVCTGGVTTNIGCEAPPHVPCPWPHLKPHRCCDQSTSASHSR